VRLFDQREEYLHGRLEHADLAAEPIEQFRRWLDGAREQGLAEPNAAALATASSTARPAARMVLLKAFDERGFVFSTHYDSPKGRALAENPWAALLFYWGPLERQVRIEGGVQPTAPEESDEIFRSRPRGAQLAAWASRQSEQVADRQELEQRMREAEQRYLAEVPRPDSWGGFRLSPQRVEFWQGRLHRLHDRFLYQLDADGLWRVQRLAP
jgi:pyridoxamine 5'-phosphate oxidase